MAICPYCQISKAFKGDIQEHTIEEHDVESFACERLGCDSEEVFKTWTELNCHNQLVHQDFRGKCHLCDFSVNGNPNNYVSLLKSHYDRNHPYECGIKKELQSPPVDNSGLSVYDKLLKLGVEGPEGTILKRAFITNFDEDMHRPFWTFEVLSTLNFLKAQKIKDSSRVLPKLRLPDGHGLNVFRRDKGVKFRHIEEKMNGSISNMDFGHLAAKGNYVLNASKTQDSMYLSNVVFTNQFLNKFLVGSIEHFARESAFCWEKVYVFSGGIYDDIKLASKPTYLRMTYVYKIIVFENEEGKKFAWSYVLPNEEMRGIRFNAFGSTLADIETMTGIRFLSNVVEYVEMTGKKKEKLKKKQKRCHICNKTFRSVTLFDNHKIDCWFPCKICDEVFSSKKNLFIHVQRDHTKLRFECYECLKRYSEMRTLLHHYLKHLEAKDVVCSLCGKQFQTIASMITHQKHVHNLSRPGRRWAFLDDERKMTYWKIEMKDGNNIRTKMERRVTRDFGNQAQPVSQQTPLMNRNTSTNVPSTSTRLTQQVRHLSLNRSIKPAIKLKQVTITNYFMKK